MVELEVLSLKAMCSKWLLVFADMMAQLISIFVDGGESSSGLAIL